MKKLELFLKDDLLKELQQVASVKGISLEEVANKGLKNYAKHLANMVNIKSFSA